MLLFPVVILTLGCNPRRGSRNTKLSIENDLNVWMFLHVMFNLIAGLPFPINPARCTHISYLNSDFEVDQMNLPYSSSQGF